MKRKNKYKEEQPSSTRVERKYIAPELTEDYSWDQTRYDRTFPQTKKVFTDKEWTRNYNHNATYPYEDKYIQEFYEYDYAPRFKRENGKDATDDYVREARQIYKNTPITYYRGPEDIGGSTFHMPLIYYTGKFSDLNSEVSPTNDEDRATIRFNTYYNVSRPAVIHELAHAFRQGYLGRMNNKKFSEKEDLNFEGSKFEKWAGTGYSPKETEYLNQAYNLSGYNGVSYDPFIEKGTTNTEIRYRLWRELYDKLGRRPTMYEVDKYITNYDPRKLQEMFEDANDYGFQMYLNGLNTNKAKQALIHVAQNNNLSEESNTNYYAKKGMKFKWYKQGGILKAQFGSIVKLGQLLKSKEVLEFIDMLKSRSARFRKLYETDRYKAEDIVESFLTEDGLVKTPFNTKLAAVENELAANEGITSYPSRGESTFNYVTDYATRSHWDPEGLSVVSQKPGVYVNYVENQPELRAYNDFMAERKLAKAAAEAEGKVLPEAVPTIVPHTGTKGVRLPYGTTITGEPARYDGKMDVVRRVNPSSKKITVTSGTTKNLGQGKSKSMTTKRQDYKSGVDSKTRNQSNHARAWVNNDARSTGVVGRNKAEERGIKTLQEQLDAGDTRYPNSIHNKYYRMKKKIAKVSDEQTKKKYEKELREFLKRIRGQYGIY